MRSCKFRDVLWGVARKAGYDPVSGNFMSNQAIPIGEYISQYVQREYSLYDNPEYTHIVAVTPDANHIVPYDILAPIGSTAAGINIGRVIEVYLVDPKTTNVPITTKFTLRDDGIHCGFEHGTSVWIKYIEPAPVFTAIPWLTNTNYAQGDVVYSPNTGDCYKSKVDNNLGHSPDTTVTDPPPNQILTQELQRFLPPSLGSEEQDKIIVIDFNICLDGTLVVDPAANTAQFVIPVMDNTSTTIYTSTHNCVGTETIASVITAMVADLSGGLGVGWTVTGDTTNKKITIQNASDFIVYNNKGSSDFARYFPTSASSSHVLAAQITQPYIPASAGTTVTQQVTQVTYGSNQLVPGGNFSLLFIDGNGVQHNVDYQSALTDSSQDILSGIIGALQTAAAGDTYLAAISPTVDFSVNSITFSTNAQMSIHATQTKTGSPYWDIVPFPLALKNPCIRGAKAQLDGEWGQTDKETSGEQMVPQEMDISKQTYTPTVTPNYTTQQKPYSRYKY